MIEQCSYSQHLMDKLYICIFPALCALQTDLKQGKTVYCLRYIIYDSQKQIDITQSKLEEKLQENNPRNL
jgi:hypothetical protein